jgi:iron complex outermembrane receptor protein
MNIEARENHKPAIRALLREISMRLSKILPTLLASAAAMPAFAQEQPSSFALGQIVVTGQQPKGIEITSQTLDAKAIDTFGRVTLDDAVALAPGVSAGNSGGSRNERLIFVRGFNRFQVPLTIDGIRVYLPADNRLDFGRFLPTTLPRCRSPRAMCPC